MRAVIMAGGKGTRLKPYTITIPKPLIPVGDKPILLIIINQLKKHGFNHITIAVNYMADFIQAYFGDGSKFDIKIDYSLEDKPLSTIAPLTLIKDLPDNFLVMNGDTLTDLNYSHLFDYHIQGKHNATVAVHDIKHTIDYGTVTIVPNSNTIACLNEKPTLELTVAMGVNVFSKAFIDKFVPFNESYGFDNLMHDSVETSNIVAYKYDGLWLDMGRHNDYNKAIEMAKESF